MKKNKILLVSGSYPNIFCGVGDYIRKLAKKLLFSNFDVSVLTSADAVIQRNEYIYPIIKKWGFFGLVKALFFVKKIRPELINLHIPTIRYRATFSIMGFFPILAKIFFKDIPVVVTIHDFSISKPHFKIFFLPLLITPEKIIITNNSDERDIVKRFPFVKNKIKKIYIAPSVELEDWDKNKEKEFLKRVNYKEKDLFISTFGLIKPDRYLEVIIKAFYELANKNDALKLLVIGGVPKAQYKQYLKSLTDLCYNLKLENKVFWLGFCDSGEVSFYLSKSLLSILLYERGASFRRSSLINCMLRDVPVVTNVNSKYGLDQDLLNSGVALFVDSIDIDKILKKTKSILYDNNTAQKMKENMRMLKNLFQWHTVIAETSDLFSGIISNRRI